MKIGNILVKNDTNENKEVNNGKKKNKKRAISSSGAKNGNRYMNADIVSRLEQRCLELMANISDEDD